jgi:hypothetical protein
MKNEMRLDAISCFTKISISDHSVTKIAFYLG